MSTNTSANSSFLSWQGLQTLAEEAERANVNEFMTAIVTDNDHKKDGAPLGWVKVQFQSISLTDVTHWVPMVMQGAGKNRGWYFIPEIGDEVLVGFAHGNFQNPVILGSLWNGKDKPAGANTDGKNSKRTIKSRGKQPGKEASSAEGGSEITFDDQNDTITIADGQKKATIVIDAKAKKIQITTKDGDVAFQAPQGDLKIVAKEITIEATGKFLAKSGKDLKISTNAGATIKASGDTKWSGSTHKDNCGGAQAVTAPESTPVDVADPYST